MKFTIALKLMDRTCVHITGTPGMFSAQVTHVNGNDAFDDLLSWEFFLHIYGNLSVLYPASYCEFGATFLILRLNTCLGLDSTSGHSHLLEFLTCVGPWIISVQFCGLPLPFSVGEAGWRIVSQRCLRPKLQNL